MSDPSGDFAVTALVPTYRAERFLRGLLDDLLAQTIADRLEIIVCDSASPEAEGSIVLEYMEHHPNIVYVRTGERENSHVGFNRCIQLARGKYLTTACTDDRHRPDALELMVRALEENPDYGLVYADSLITEGENESFARNTATRRYSWPDFSVAMALSTCPFGSQAFWRRSVHEDCGLFSPDYWIAGDQDLFLRIAWKHGALHLAETLGLFLRRPDSNSGAANAGEATRDVLRVLRRYRREIPLSDIYPGLDEHGDSARAAALFDMGNLCALSPYNDSEMALSFYEEAVEALRACDALGDESLAAYANNVGCVLATGGMLTKARSILARAGGVTEGRANLARVETLEARAGSVRASELEFVELKHPVVSASRETRALTVGEHGELVWSATRARRPWDVYDGPNGVPLAGNETVVVREEPAALPHVLIVMYGWAESGGGTMLPRQVAKGLVRRGHRVSVFYAAVEERSGRPGYHVEASVEDGVELYGLHNRPVPFLDLEAPEREVDDPRVRAVFEGLLADLRPDRVHFFNLLGLGMSLASSAKSAGIPTLWSSNNYWPVCPRLYLFGPDLSLCDGPSLDGVKCAECVGRPELAGGFALRVRRGLELLGRDIDRHLAVSERVRDIFCANGIAPERIEVCEQQPESLDRVWRALGEGRTCEPRAGSALRVGFIGSLMPHKGPRVLVEALQLLPAGSVEGLFFGDADPGVAAQLEAIGGPNEIRLAGRYELDELACILAGVDIVVVPSIWEDCAPFVVAEALSARLPVVGSRIGGIPDFIVDGETGFLFEAGDAKGLARCIAHFLADPALLGSMRAAITAPRGFDAYLDEITTQVTPESPCKATPDVPIPRQRYSLYHGEEHEASHRAWLVRYAELFAGQGPVLDLGCGTGLFLDLLRERGTAGIGVDSDPEMVAACRARGFDARVADVRDSILTPSDLGGVHLGHIIEHMDGPAMIALLESCVAALRPGGLVLIRTPNWQNDAVRLGGFWLDHTHVRPYPVELLERVFLDLGLEVDSLGFEDQGWNDTYILGRKPDRNLIPRHASPRYANSRHLANYPAKSRAETCPSNETRAAQ